MEDGCCCSACSCINDRNRFGGEERRVEGEPDVISSMIVNNEQYLTVVANRNEIENEEEFKKLLIKMYEENSFHSVKFSTDISDPEKVYMKVYRWRGDIKKEELLLRIKYYPCEQ